MTDELKEYDYSDIPKATGFKFSDRQRIIREIFDTEETYLHHLKLIVKNFQSPLKKTGIIPNYVVSEIFQNIEQIIKLNKELLDLLNEYSVGEAFVRMGHFFKFYSLYASNHERALASLIQWQEKCEEFKLFRLCQEELPDMHGLKLNALLITPVQRVPRYEMLLNKLLEKTENDDPDFENIKKAAADMSKVAEHINSHMANHDNMQKMIAIQRSLSGGNVPQLIEAGRKFLKEGDMKKVSRKGGKVHDRKLFLFSDMLIYCKPTLYSHKPYKCSCILPLKHCKVEKLLGHIESQFTLFIISCKEERLLLYSDPKTVDSWITLLKSTICELDENRSTLRKPSSARTPLRGLALLKQIKLEKLQSPTRSPIKESSVSETLCSPTEKINVDCLINPFRSRRGRRHLTMSSINELKGLK